MSGRRHAEEGVVVVAGACDPGDAHLFVNAGLGFRKARRVRWMNLRNRLGDTEMTVKPRWRIYFELWM